MKQRSAPHGVQGAFRSLFSLARWLILPTPSPLLRLARPVDPANEVNEMGRNALVDDLAVHQLQLLADPRPNVSAEPTARGASPIMQPGGYRLHALTTRQTEKCFSQNRQTAIRGDYRPCKRLRGWPVKCPRPPGFPVSSTC